MDRAGTGGGGEGRTTHPPYLYPGYKSTVLRAPAQELIMPKLGPDSVELTSPVFGHQELGRLDEDLTVQHAGEPQGQRIVVTGRVLDGAGRPVRNALVEIWQANAAGRYNHLGDIHPAPLDPNFTGAGRCLTDGDGRYRFVTIKPGAYPWGNHHNAWRPAHIHFSVFGTAFTQRLFAYDPIFQSIPDERDREKLVSRFDLDTTTPEWALGYQWDIVLGDTPMEV